MKGSQTRFHLRANTETMCTQRVEPDVLLNRLHTMRAITLVNRTFNCAKPLTTRTPKQAFLHPWLPPGFPSSSTHAQGTVGIRPCPIPSAPPRLPSPHPRPPLFLPSRPPSSLIPIYLRALAGGGGRGEVHCCSQSPIHSISHFQFWRHQSSRWHNWLMPAR